MAKHNVRVQQGGVSTSAENSKKIAKLLNPKGGLILKA